MTPAREVALKVIALREHLETANMTIDDIITVKATALGKWFTYKFTVANERYLRVAREILRDEGYQMIALRSLQHDTYQVMVTKNGRSR